MSTTIPPAVLETILIRLTTLFLIGTAGDTTAARQAAAQMLAAYNPTTEEQLCLAATIISFTFQSLQALAQGADPAIPVTRILRLRSGAVSLSREADKARRRLAQLQKPQPAPKPAEAAAPVPIPPPPPTVTPQSEADRQRDQRIAANVKKAEARMLAYSNLAAPSPAAPHPA